MKKKIINLIGAILLIKTTGYNSIYAKEAAKVLYNVPASEYHEAIMQLAKPSDYRCFIDWRKIRYLVYDG